MLNSPFSDRSFLSFGQKEHTFLCNGSLVVSTSTLSLYARYLEFLIAATSSDTRELELAPGLLLEFLASPARRQECRGWGRSDMVRSLDQCALDAGPLCVHATTLGFFRELMPIKSLQGHHSCGS